MDHMEGVHVHIVIYVLTLCNYGVMDMVGMGHGMGHGMVW